MDKTEAPLEVIAFGPGYGECILVRLRPHSWMIVDSCINEQKIVVALDYLRNIGANPATDVRLIVLSHWHDDHIRGAAEMVRECTQAKISIPQAFCKESFTKFALAHGQSIAVVDKTGTQEIVATLQFLRNAKERRVFASAGRNVLEEDDVTVRCLSPSDESYERFLSWVVSQTPMAQTQYRAAPCHPNAISIALWIKVDETTLLLGSDLEKRSVDHDGWSAAISEMGIGPRPTVFKVPHHGSDTGQDERIWQVLADHPVAIVTPFQNGRVSLPTEQGKDWLRERTRNAYLTASGENHRSPKRDSSVEKVIKATVLGSGLFIIPDRPGCIKLTQSGHTSNGAHGWDIDLADGAHHLGVRNPA